MISINSALADVRKEHDQLEKDHKSLAKQVGEINTRFLVMVAGTAGASTALVQGLLKALGVH